jgi:hypothetical protein
MILRLLLTASGGVAIGWIYSGYKFYGTINPRKQTLANLRQYKKSNDHN